MNKRFYKSGFISASFLLPICSLMAYSSGRWWTLIPLAGWWVYTGVMYLKQDK